MVREGVEDLAVNENMEVYISDRGDLATVRGRAAFEQKLKIRLIDNYVDIIGDVDRENVLDLVEVEARRVADEMDELESVAEFEAAFSEDQLNKVEVTVLYDTGEILEFDFET